MLDLFIGTAHAQGAGGASAGGAGSQMLLMFGAIFAIMYFLVIRPQNKRLAEHQALVAGMKKGDAIVTVGGLHGRIAAVEDKTISLEVGKGLRITVDKDKVARSLGAGAAPVADDGKQQQGT